MERNDVAGLYDEDYAAQYDERFLLAEWPKKGAEFEADVLRKLLDGDDPRWLDVGCGTGYFLSRFPDVARAGLDLSPAMLDRARRANPDALFLRHGDFRDDVEDWHGAWSVVSCMWTAYNYVESMAQFDGLIGNLVRWTRPGGSVFIPVMDLEDLRYVQVGYEEHPEVWGGTIALTGATWTWDEPTTGKRHEHLVAPHVEHFIRLLEPHFARIEVVRYPLVQEGFISRKAVVATGRRAPGETGSALVVRHPLPAGAHDPTPTFGTSSAVPDTGLAGLQADVADLRRQVDTIIDLLSRPAAPDRPAAERYDIVGVVHDQVGGIRRELAELSERLFAAGSGPVTSRRAGSVALPVAALRKARRAVRRLVGGSHQGR